MDAISFIARFKNTILSITIILLALYFGNKFYSEQAKQMKALNKKIIEEEDRNQALKSIKLSQNNIEKLKEAVSNLDAGSVMNIINNLARASGVKVTSIRPGTEKQLQEHTKLPFNVALALDSYHALGKFVSKLESEKNIFTVDSLEMSLDSQTKTLTANILIHNIFLKD